MKTFLLTFLIALSFNSNSQTVVFADPGVGSLYITNSGGATVDANNLSINQPYILNVPLFNSNPSVGIPPQTIRIKIGLGSRMIINPGYDLSTAPLSNYFSWSYAVVSGQGTITGELIATLPPDFIGTASFSVIPNVVGTSTITANVLIVNNNPGFILSDESSANNFAQLQYTVTNAPVPVNFTKVNLGKQGCNIRYTFFTENEINVDHYEIEASKNGTVFNKVGQVTATGKPSYVSEFPITRDIAGTNLLVRVKSVDHDGYVKYSETKAVNGTCEPQLEYNIYPNPVVGESVAIRATSGLFNGKYKIMVMDMTGRVIFSQSVDMKNITQYSYRPGKIATGKYIMRLANVDGSQSGVVPFEKL